MSFKLNVISLAKDKEDLFKKIVSDLNEKHGGNEENFLMRLDAHCLDIAKDRQCEYLRIEENLYFNHKNSQLNLEQYIKREVQS